MFVSRFTSNRLDTTGICCGQSEAFDRTYPGKPLKLKPCYTEKQQDGFVDNHVHEMRKIETCEYALPRITHLIVNNI